MIISKLIGGLGNQMWQYVAGRRAAWKVDTNFYLDISNFQLEGIVKREYSLGIFNIKAGFATNEQIQKLKTGHLTLLLKSTFPRVSNLINIKYKKSHIREKVFDKKLLNIPDNSYLEGQWQNEKYFKDCEEIIRKDFCFKQKILKRYEKIAKEIKKCESLSIHVRLGDYLQPKHINLYYQCPPKYFNKAVSDISRKTKIDKIFLFCEDQNWGKKYLKTEIPFVNVVQKDLFDDWQICFQLMSMCKHNIIVNSSYSWWAAWLNKNPQKIIISP